MALNKFDRNYILTITKANGESLTVTLPFTIEFDITRNTLSSANVCQVRIYNLSETNRAKIRYNSFDYGTPDTNITLLAGYGKNLAVIFTGNITQAWSVREGVNFITQIECFAGGFAFVNSKTNKNVAAGTSLMSTIKNIMGDLVGITVGSIGPSYSGSATRGNTYSGNTNEILNQLTGGGFFIDNGKAYALANNEFIESFSSPLVINSASGLLGTPTREQTLIRFDMLFEPSLNVGTQVELRSATNNTFDGKWIVTMVKHRGMISAAVCGSVITTGEFLFTTTPTAATPASQIP